MKTRKTSQAAFESSIQGTNVGT